MKSSVAWWIVISACVVAGPRWTHGQDFRELKVHLAQANNNSPYSFVRAKFEPGEVSDPWAVRFLDEKGAEVPYFVWDSIAWEDSAGGFPARSFARRLSPRARCDSLRS